MVIENDITVFLTLTESRENEVVEFKKAENNFDFDDLYAVLKETGGKKSQLNKFLNANW